MTSKNLFFKLLKEDFKIRLWTFVISCLSFFFSLIVVTAMIISFYLRQTEEMLQSSSEMYRSDIIDTFKGFIGIDNSILAFIFVVLSLLVAFSGFAYLYSKKKVDLYHSLPVKRETLFIIKTINSILIVLIPYIVCVLVSLLMISANVSDAGLVLEVFKSIIEWSLLFLLNYFVAVLAVMLTGNMLIGVLACGFFYFYFPFFAMMIQWYQSTFFYTYYSSGFVVNKLLPNMSSLFIIFNAGKLGIMSRMLIALTVSVLLSVLNLLLYKQRSSESAGKSIAFNIIKLPVKFMTVIFIGMFMYITVYEMMDASAYWGIFSAVVGVTITHCTMEIIYNQDFKKIFAKKIEMGLCMVISFLLVAVFEWDIFGYDRYVPNINDIQSAAVVSNLLEANYNQYYYKMKIFRNGDYDDVADVDYVSDDKIEADLFKKMNIEDKEAVMELARICISGGKKEYESYDNSYEISERVIISYKLKSGRSIQRVYFINYNSIAAQLAAIYNKEGFKKAMYPVLSEDSKNIVSVDYNGIGFDDKHIVFNDETVKAQFIDTYKKELMNLKLEDRVQSYAFASIRFNDAYMQEALDIDLGSVSREYSVDLAADNTDTAYVQAMDTVGYYPIYPEFKETISLLKKLGADVLEKLPAEEVDRVEVNYSIPKAVENLGGVENYTYENKQIAYKDKEDIEKVLDKLILCSTPYKDDIIDQENNISVYIFLKGDIDSAFGDRGGFYFRRDNFPDNIKFIVDEIKKAK